MSELYRVIINEFLADQVLKLKAASEQEPGSARITNTSSSWPPCEFSATVVRLNRHTAGRGCTRCPTGTAI